MIAIDIPMPDSCSECRFRDGPYDCRLDCMIRPINFARAPNCPLQRVEWIVDRLLAPNDDRSRIKIGQQIGEELEKRGVIQFHVGMHDIRLDTNGDRVIMRYSSPEITGSMPVIMPKGL